MNPTIGRRFPLILLTAIVVWPVLHLILSLTLGFSSWRFGGWGMYASPHPDYPFTGIFVFLDDKNPGGVEEIHRVPVFVKGADWTEVFRYISSLEFSAPDRPRTVSSMDLNSGQEARALRSLAKAIRHFRRAEDIRNLGDLARLKLANGCPKGCRVLVVLWTRRIDLKDSLLYADFDIYEYDGIRIQKKKGISGRKQDIMAFLRGR